MRTIDPGTAAARALEPLFSAELPARPRLLGVLDGTLRGVVTADDADPPSWAIATELSDGTTYVGGQLEASTLASGLRRPEPASGEIVVGLAGPDDPVRAMLPDRGIRWSRAIDFTERVPPDDEADRLAAPPGTRVVVMDAALFARTAWYADTLVAFGSVERWLELGLGLAVVDAEGALLCEATAGPVIRGSMEMGVRTAPEHRRRGLATLASRHLAREIEGRGLAPWWNTNAENEGSIRIARALGFRRERPYDLAWWEVAALR